jgi:branched-chain amino acid transport system permease protein
MNLQIVIELLISGVTLGGLYALMAFALSLSLSTTRVLNIAHGGFLIIGAALGMLLTKYLHLPFLLALPLFVIAGGIFGYLFEITVVRPLLGKPPNEILIGSILITFGFTMALDAFLSFYWAKFVDPQPTFSLTLHLRPLRFLGLNVSGSRIVIMAFASVMVLFFHFLLKYTSMGKAARAIAQDSEGALITGINPQWIALQVYVLGILTTAIAGAFYVLLIPLEPYSSFRLTLIALTIIVIGGVGSLLGALVGGVVLGTAEVLTAFFITPAWSPMTYLLIFFLVLVVKPEGFLGREGR